VTLNSSQKNKRKTQVKTESSSKCCSVKTWKPRFNVLSMCAQQQTLTR